MKIIKQDGHSKLIEYREADEVKRVVLPINEHDLSLGIPYGFPFAEMLKPHVCEPMAERIEVKLHNAGIWTAEDATNNPGTVQGAVLSAYGVDYAILLQLAKQFKEV